MQANETFLSTSPFGYPDQPTRRPQFHAVMSIAAARSAKTAISSLVVPLFQNLRRRFFIAYRRGFRLTTQCLDLKEIGKRRQLKAGLFMRGPKLRL